MYRRRLLLLPILVTLFWGCLGCRKQEKENTLVRNPVWTLQSARFWTASQPAILLSTWKRTLSGRGFVREEFSLRGHRLQDGKLLWRQFLGSVSEPQWQSLYAAGVLHLRNHLWFKDHHYRLLHVPTGRISVVVTPSLLTSWRPGLKGQLRTSMVPFKAIPTLRSITPVGFSLYVDSNMGKTYRFDVLTGQSNRVTFPASRYGRGLVDGTNKSRTPAFSKHCLSTDWFVRYRSKVKLPTDWPSLKSLQPGRPWFSPWFLQTLCPLEKQHPILVRYKITLDGKRHWFARFDKKGRTLWARKFPGLRNPVMVYWKKRLLLVSVPAYYQKVAPFFGAVNITTGRWLWRQKWKQGL